jgi:mono/diheme cytochrome c family protein
MRGAIGAMRLGVLMLACWVTAAGARAETALERGRYLVDAIMGCDGCHTPRPGGVFDMSKRFAGGLLVFEQKEFVVRGSNISSDREHGIGAWSDAEFKTLMTEGVRPSGVKIAPQMPFAFYRILTARDLDAVTAYVRSAAPQAGQPPPPVYRAPMQYEAIPGGERPFTDAMLNDPLKRGFYIATIAHCMECHARRPDGSAGYADSWGKGGHVMKGPYGEVTVSNITSDPDKGIGRMTDAELRRVFTQGIGRDGRTLKLPMARQVYFSKMTDADVDALIAWIRTIPPLK